MPAHARLSPSSADRWFTCPASIRLSEDLPPLPTSFPAAEGTALHEVAAHCLEFGLEPGDFWNKIFVVGGHAIEITDERLALLDDYLDWIREQPGRLFVEQRVDLDPWLPGQFGTLDVGIVSDTLITILDWKCGWLPVDLVGNRQLRAYALGFWHAIARHESDATLFRIIIAQQRHHTFGHEWFVTLDQLLAFGKELRAAGARTVEPNAPIVASERGCRYCPVIQPGGPGCATYERFVLDIVGQTSETLDEDDALGAFPELPNTSLMTLERRAHIVRHERMFRAFLERLKEDTLRDALARRPTAGLKAVEGDKGDRKWIDEDAAKALMEPVLGEQIYNKKLISPAGLERLAKPTRRKEGHPELWAEARKLYAQADGKPVLAPESDPRPPYVVAEAAFEDEPENL